jgi:mannose-1-phosphate guanylyltransferase
MIHNTKNSYIRSDDKLVVAIGVADLVIVSTKDAVMVANKDNIQDFKVITVGLKAKSRGEGKLALEVYRPWGKYNAVDRSDGYQTKHITVNSGAKLGVRMHHQRAEYWVVVSGTAKITNGDKTFLLSKNESTYIPLSTIHALKNPGEVPLEIIEVQSGSYLGGYDIVRFEDRYGRAIK